MFARELASTAARQLVNYQWQDNESKAVSAVTIARQQLASNPDVYVSGVKPQYMAIEGAISKTSIPHFVWIFDAVLRPKKENNFRTRVNFKVESPLLIDFAAKRKAAKVVVLYVALPHTEYQY